MRLINIIVRILAIFPTVSMMVACQSPPVPKMGPELATTQKENEKFIIRVTAFAQNALFVQVAGAYYVFESRPKNESDWREIMVFLDDDPVPIREDGIQFVNDHVAYVYMGWLYAVTTDGGHSWKVWDVWNHKQLLSQSRPGYNCIQTVTIQESGLGEMTLNLIGDVTHAELFTEDYGVGWRLREK